MIKIATFFILIVLILGSVYLGYKSINSQTTVTSQKTEIVISPTSNPVASPTVVIEHISLQERPTAGNTDNSQTVAAIKEGFQSKPYSSVVGAYFNNKEVLAVPYGIGGMVDKSTPKEAMQKLDKFFELATGPWNFESNNPMAKKLLEADPTNFTGTIIGTSPDRFAVAITLNDEFMIDKVLMVSDWNSILP
jgi:hypothetical protein